MQEDGKIGFINKKMVVGKEFVQVARSGEGEPDKRFRFASKCVEGNCPYWKKNQCNLIDVMVGVLGSDASQNQLPACSIRNECRWFDQYGSQACHVCPEIIRGIK